MKKTILVIIAVAAGGWWHFIGSRKLDTGLVEQFYRDLEHATLSRQPDNLCALLADDFHSTSTVLMGGASRSDTAGKEMSCEAYRGMYDAWDKIGQRMGGIVQLDSKYEIHRIDISRDGKTATVDFSSSLDVAGSLMNIRSRSTDTLVRRNGKVLMLRSEGRGSIGSGG